MRNTVVETNPWISVNLPFDTCVDPLDIPDYPAALEQKAQRELGFTESSLDDASEYLRSVSDVLDDIQAEIINRLGWIELDALDDFPFPSDVDRILQDEYGEMAEVQTLLTYRNQKHRYQTWLEKQPEYILWENALHHVDERHNRKTFVGRGLAQAGTLIEVRQDDGTMGRFLIGHMTASGGICDCDLAFDPLTAIVTRYKIVWRDPVPSN